MRGSDACAILDAMRMHRIRLGGSRSGFSLPELLIVVTIIALVAVGVMMLWRKQVDRGYDVKRKSDLARLRKVFEEYYNDKGCYPPQDLWDAFVCGGTGQDFLKTYFGGDIPCDPQTREKYMYQAIDTAGNSCSAQCGGCLGYRALGMIHDTTDMDIWYSGCNPTQGCGFADKRFNYGIAVGGDPYAPGFVAGTPPGATPTPTPVYPSGDWFCVVGQSQCQRKTAGCGSSLRAQGCIGFADAYTTACSSLCQSNSKLYTCVAGESCN